MFEDIIIIAYGLYFANEMRKDLLNKDSVIEIVLLIISFIILLSADRVFFKSFWLLELANRSIVFMTQFMDFMTVSITNLMILFVTVFDTSALLQTEFDIMNMVIIILIIFIGIIVYSFILVIINIVYRLTKQIIQKYILHNQR